MPFELTPRLEPTPTNPPTYSVGIAETYSWVPIDNDIERPLYARATYVTNMSDMSVNLEASNITIPAAISIRDGEDANIKVSVVDLGPGEGGALRVVTQEKNYNNLISINNFNDGWVVDDVKRPVLTFRKANATNITWLDYIIKSHDGTGIIAYEWWKGDITIASGPVAPNWSTAYGDPLNNSSGLNYKIYQDVAGSNVGNTANTNLAILKHSGILNGNTSNFFIPSGNEDISWGNNGTGNVAVWTLFLKRLDASQEQKMFFGLTFNES